MKVCLSGLGLSLKFNMALSAKPAGLVLDHNGSRGATYEIPSEIYLILRSDINKYWAKFSYLWDESDPRRGQSDDLEKAQIKAMSYVLGKLDEVIDWSYRYNYDYISIELPRLLYEELPPLPKDISDRMIFTVKNLADLEWAVQRFKMVGISSKIELDDFKKRLSSVMTIVRDRGVLFHAWGRTDKATLLSGVFYSVDSTSWNTGKFGNLYRYLGNLNIKVYNPRRSTYKNAQERFVDDAVSFGIDRNEFLSGDKKALSTYNAHQWASLGKDAEKVVGYWSTTTQVSDGYYEKKSLDSLVTKKDSTDRVVASHEPSSLYSRTCNSCFLSGQCPAFQVDSDCSITTRLQVDDPSDIQALINRIIEIQGERVIFGAFAERMQNAGINPEVSKEMESLMNIMKTAKTVLAPVSENEVTIKAKGSGVLNQLFGGYGRSSGGSKPSQSQKIIDVSPLDED